LCLSPQRIQGARLSTQPLGGTSHFARALFPPRVTGSMADDGPMDSRAAILVIEDSPVVQHLLRATLTPMGVGLLFAPDGETGLDLARTHLPESIILDIGLPGIDGWEVLRRLRSDSLTTGTQVLVLTAHAQESMKQAATSLGADGFMTKPFRPDDLRLAVGGLLERASTAFVAG